MLAPNVLLAGAQKCGTTFLARALATHPEVCLGEVKEPDIFLRGDETRYPSEFDRLYGHDDQATLRLDASVLYIASEAALERASRWCGPDARVLVVVRNPVERTLSGYLHLKKRLSETRSVHAVLDGVDGSFGGVRSIEIERALRAMQSGELDLFAGIHSHDERWLNALYISNSMYHSLLVRLDRWFAPQRTLVVLFEDLRDRPVQTLEIVRAFLGLDRPMPSPNLKGARNRTRLPRIIPLERSTRRRWVHFQRWVTAERMWKAVRTVTANDFPVDLRKGLAERFHEENERLSLRLGVDLEACWRIEL